MRVTLIVNGRGTYEITEAEGLITVADLAQSYGLQGFSLIVDNDPLAKNKWANTQLSEVSVVMATIGSKAAV